MNNGNDGLCAEPNDGSSIKVLKSENDCDIKSDSNSMEVADKVGSGEKVKQKKKKMKKKKQSQAAAADLTPEDEEDDLFTEVALPSAVARVYKESSSLDSGIESDCRGSISEHSDLAFIAFLDRHDEFLDDSVRYTSPKFTLNRVDNVLAFTLHAAKVAAESIRCEMLPVINAARVRFATAAPKVQNYAFFVKMSPLPQSKGNTNNNGTAMIVDAIAESWDNNVVFQVFTRVLSISFFQLNAHS